MDSSLNAMGRAQAHAFFEKYKSMGFNKIYTSALKRTTQTVEEFIQLGIPCESLSGLNEISWGSNEGQKITPEEDVYYHWMMKQWEEGNTALRIQGGESPEEVAARQRPVIKKIFQHDKDETLLICMHGRAMRILLCQLLHYPLKSMDMFEHANLCLYLLEFTGTMFKVNKHNDISHLKDVKVSRTETHQSIP